MGRKNNHQVFGSREGKKIFQNYWTWRLVRKFFAWTENKERLSRRRTVSRTRWYQMRQWTRLGGVHSHSQSHADKAAPGALHSSPLSLNHIKIASVKSNISRQLWSRKKKKKNWLKISSALSRCVVFFVQGRWGRKEKLRAVSVQGAL